MKSNPLATRFVAPGRISWQSQFGSPEVHRLAELCIDQYRARCAIVGPHGSGKSTLVEHLIPLLGIVAVDLSADSSLAATTPSATGAANGDTTALHQIVRLRLRGWWASTRLVLTNVRQWFKPNRILIIDGYEQLPRTIRGLVLMATWLRGAGLIVTSHRLTALPTLVELNARAELVQQLLDQLLPSDTPRREELLDLQTIQSMLKQHRGNVRELFMELYDVLEDQ